jgi:hypothetical protein
MTTLWIALGVILWIASALSIILVVREGLQPAPPPRDEQRWHGY